MHNKELHIDCKLLFKRNQVGHSKDTILLGVHHKSSQLLVLLTCSQSQDDKNALVKNTPRRHEATDSKESFLKTWFQIPKEAEHLQFSTQQN